MADDFSELNELDKLSNKLDDLQPRPATKNRGRMLYIKIFVVISILTIFAIAIVFAYKTGQNNNIHNNLVTLAPEGELRTAPDDPGGEQINNREKEIFKALKEAGISEDEAIEGILKQPNVNEDLDQLNLKQRLSLEREKNARLAQENLLLKQKLTDNTIALEAEKSLKESEQVAKKGQAVVTANQQQQQQVKQAQKTGQVPPKKAPPPAPVKKLEPEVANDIIKTNSAPKNTDQTGQWRIQLAALKTERAAINFWQNIQRRHADILQNLTLHTERIEVPEKGAFYRVQAESFTSDDAANQACAALKKRKQPCIIKKIK
jgi:cell division septation protein DedD